MIAVVQNCVLKSCSENIWKILRSSNRKCFVKMVFLEISQKKKKNTMAQVFFCEFAKFLRTLFFYRTPPVTGSTYGEWDRPIDSDTKLLSATFVKLQFERQQFTKIVLHHECFCELFQKFSDHHFELFMRGCPCPGRNDFEINHSV